MPELIPGGDLGLIGANIQNTLSGAVNVLVMVFIALIFGGLAFGIFYLLKEKVLSFNIPVTLRFEVGDSVLVKRDMMKFVSVEGNRESKEVKFKKNQQVVVEVPDDIYSYIDANKRTSKKSFEAFVKNNQATWVLPKPLVGVVKQTRTFIDGQGKQQKEEVDVPTFVTAPSNLLRYYQDRVRRNAELNLKMKWWQNPQIIAIGMMSIFLIGVLFLYLMNKSTAEVAMQAVNLGGRIIEAATGQVIS